MTIARIALAPTRWLVGALIAIAAPYSFSQPAATPPSEAKPLAFDAISIKPNQGGSGFSGQTVNGEAVISSRIMIRTPPDGYSASNITAKSLIATAYGIKDDLISGGPSWITSTRYDVEAKVLAEPATSRPLTKDQRNQMLRSLLADRFQLTTHNETREAPIYQLIVAKSGSRLHEATPGDPYPNGPKGPDGVSHPGMMMTMQGGLTAQAVPISNLVDMLSRQLHRTVVDKTGLTGKYDIQLAFTSEQDHDAPGPIDSSGPSIFTAIEEQLGLKLESTKGPVTALVIDHIEKPSEN